MNFGPSAESYAKFRAGFPPSFFERVPLAGVVLDLGSGTGSLAQGYAAQGYVVCAVDISAEMLAQARGPLVKLVSRAEDCTFADSSFDHVVVGSAWHWFDGASVAANCLRMLKPGGTLVIASLEYELDPGSVAHRTEALILKFHPKWSMVGVTYHAHERSRLLERTGFTDLESHDYRESITYSQEAWRGRMQACNGVIAFPDDDTRMRFDDELSRLLAPEGEPLEIPHRISWVIGRKPVVR